MAWAVPFPLESGLHSVVRETYEVCTTITAQNNYVVTGPSGALSLRAGSSVVLGSGFSVTTGGLLTVEIDPGLQMPEQP